MKKFMALFVASTMIISNTLSVFAAPSVDYKANNTFTNAMVENGFFEEIQSSQAKGNAVEYSVRIRDDVVNTIIESDLADGKKLVFKEGTIENTLILKNNGEMYLDGKLVKVTTTTSEQKISIRSAATETSEQKISTRSAATENWKYGSSAFAPGPYKTYKYTTTTEIDLGYNIGAVSLGAAVAALTEGNIVAGALAAGAYYKYVDWMKSNKPYGRALYATNEYYSNNKPKLKGRPYEYYYKIETTYYKNKENGKLSDAYPKKDTAYAKQLIYV